ncbi:MAG TPA: MFS transporter, partial [Beutenbergiaceae bacterium]|nr:MFS transporter [Beutenbergiaceae bacterium]
MESSRSGQHASSPTPATAEQIDTAGDPAPSAPTSPRAWIVVFAAGVLAAMHVWKFPGAMHLIRQDLNVSLVEAGTLLGIVQVAAMLLGLAVSVVSVRLGMRRTLLLGLALLGVGSLLGALSTQTWHLMVTRGVEGIGFILATIVGPPLIRQLVPATRVASAIGWWSAFQGTAVFIAMIVSTFLLSQTQLMAWNGWWVIMAVATFASMAFVVWQVPQDR